MNLASIVTRALNGVESPDVTVEVHVSNGLPSLSIVGLPEVSVKESKDRVRSALLSSGFQLPPKRITVNLAPADLPKSGGRYDLPIAIGILIATGQLEVPNIDDYEFIGELALEGALRAVKGALPSLLAAKSMNRICILPLGNQGEAILTILNGAKDSHFKLVRNLKDVCKVLMGEVLDEIEWVIPQALPPVVYPVDLSDISGQLQAKRVLEISASGGHSLMMVGPPGAGKSMLASRLVTLLPPLTQQEAIESASIHSISGKSIGQHDFYSRTFMNPHHTASAAAMVGGGSNPKPGAISLAHYGVLFLDELPEFNRAVLEALREPLETKKVEVSRVRQQVTFPANCLLVTAMNPSPSGYFPDDPHGRCKDTPDQINRYQKKISGPLLDRIDLHLEVPAVDLEALQDKAPNGETSIAVRRRVIKVRQIQLQRQNCLNSELTPLQLKRYAVLDEDSKLILEKAVNQLGVSARGYHRILRTARTLADMINNSQINAQQIAEALSYRSLDRV